MSLDNVADLIGSRFAQKSRLARFEQQKETFQSDKKKEKIDPKQAE
jgi:hypothetical protein